MSSNMNAPVTVDKMGLWLTQRVFHQNPLIPQDIVFIDTDGNQTLSTVYLDARDLGINEGAEAPSLTYLKPPTDNLKI